MDGSAVGDVWLPTRTDGSLWLRAGIVNAGWKVCAESTSHACDGCASGRIDLGICQRRNHHSCAVPLAVCVVVAHGRVKIRLRCSRLRAWSRFSRFAGLQLLVSTRFAFAR